MKIREGIELVSIEWIREKCSGRRGDFLRRCFTRRERDYCENRRMSHEHFAVRWAAKQAVLKALAGAKRPRVRLCEIEVVKLPGGKPSILLSPEVRKKLRVPAGSQIELSMTHERSYAMAAVVAVVA